MDGTPRQTPAPAAGDDSLEDRVDLSRYWHIILKRRWLGVGILVATLGLALVLTVRAKKIYRAEATVQIDQQPPEVLGGEQKEVVQLGTGDYWDNRTYYETQYKVLKSRAVAKIAAQILDLARNKDFAAAMGFKPGDKSVDDIADMLSDAVMVEPVKDSMLAKVQFESPDPKVAELVANGIAEAYRERNAEYRLTSTDTAAKWLTTEADRLRKQLDDSATKLYEFKKDNDILSISLEDKENTIAQQIAKTTDELTTVRNKRIELSAQRDRLVAEKDTDPLSQSDVALIEAEEYHGQGGVVQALKKAYEDENLALAALEGKYGDEMPQVKDEKQKLDTIHAELTRETQNLIAAVDGQYHELLTTEKSLEAELADLTQQAFVLGEREITYDQLKRQNDNNEQLYTLVTGRQKMSGLLEQLRSNNVNILDEAELPRLPVRPNLRLNLILAAFLGVLLAFAAMFGVEYIDRSVKSHIDIEDGLGLAFLGMVPRVNLAESTLKTPDLYVHAQPKSMAAEACRTIRTNVLFASADRQKRALLVTSAGPAEGKTLTAVSLAVTMAQGGNRTLLVDTDMRRPRLHRALGVPSDRGVSNLIVGQAALADCVRKTDVDGLFVLPCGAIPPNPSELLQSERFAALVKELGEKYDTVIYDSPPVVAVTDAAILSRLVDGTIVVARAGRTHREVLRRGVMQVTRVGGKVLGCVLNDLELKRPGYGGADYYYYYYNRYGYQTQAEEKA